MGIFKESFVCGVVMFHTKRTKMLFFFFFTMCIVHRRGKGKTFRVKSEPLWLFVICTVDMANIVHGT